MGATGPDVKKLQLDLKALGYKLRGTGTFAALTEAAVIDFQQRYKLTVDGWAGSVTLKAIAKAIKQLDKGTIIPPGKVEFHGLKIYEVDSRRTKNLIKRLRDKIVLKMVQTDEKSLRADIERVRNHGDLAAFGRIDSAASQAMSDLKFREKTGRNDGDDVEDTQKIAGGKKGYAWCVYAGQVSTAIAEVLTGCISPMHVSGSCATMRSVTKKSLAKMIIEKFTSALAGDKLVYKYTNGTGHFATLKRLIDELSSENNEGNTTAGRIGDKVVREGGGHYTTQRSKNGGKGMVLAMIIRPSVGLKKVA